MNKRQRKKQFVRVFSKLYDDSLKYGGFGRGISISTFKDGRATHRIYLVLNKSMSYDFGCGELPGISLDGYCLECRTVKGL